MVNAHFFSAHWPDLQCGGPGFPWLPEWPMVPTIALLAAALVNYAGNCAGAMPVL